MENLYTGNDYPTNPESYGFEELHDKIKKLEKSLSKMSKELKRKKKKIKKLKKENKHLSAYQDKRKPVKCDTLGVAFESLPAALYLADTVLKRKKRREE